MSSFSKSFSVATILPASFLLFVGGCALDNPIDYSIEQLGASTPAVDIVTEPEEDYVLTSNEGREFSLVFNRNNSSANKRIINVTGRKDTEFELIFPDGLVEKYSINASEVREIEIDAKYELTLGVESGKIIEVDSVEPIVVYGINQEKYTTDAFTVTPNRNHSNEYIISSYNSPSSYFSIYSLEDNMTAEVIYPDNSVESIILDKGEVYTKQTSTDPSGTYIRSDKKIAVFSGSRCANVPVGVSACDTLVEQMIPINSWKKHFLTVPIATRTGGDTFRIYASEDSTNVWLNDTQIISNLSKGDFWEKNDIKSVSEIISDKPIMVVQYSNSSDFDGVTSDPFMMIVPGTDQYLNKYIFSTPPSGFNKHFVNVVHPTSELNKLLLDNTSIADKFSVIGATDFSAASIEISAGPHNISSTVPFGIFVHGFASYDSYGYPGGFNLK